MVLQQAVNGRARQRFIGDHASGFKQAFDLAHRAAWVVAFGRQYGRLQGWGDLGLAPVDANLWCQTCNTFFAPGVVPGLNGLLGQHAPLRVGNGVFALGQFTDGFLQLAALQSLTADQ